MPLMPDQVDDFVTNTISLFKRHSWTDLSMQYQHYISARLIADKQVKETGGVNISFRIKTKNTGNARATGLFSQDSTKVDDNSIAASIPWAMQTTSYGYDIDEDLFQSDRETIVSTLRMREHDCMSDMAELNEDQFWGAPKDSSDKVPMGIPFWIQKNTANAEGDFLGGNPTGFSAGAAGVDSTRYPRWRNWTFKYDTPTTDDLVRKVKKAIRFCEFKAPVPHPEIKMDGKSNMFTTYRTLEPLERLAETRNDNLGSDLAKYMGNVSIGGVPIEWVSWLENNDLTDPIYGVNWKYFRPFVKKGINMRRTGPATVPGMHNVRSIHFDNSVNYACYNRRTQFVGCKS